MISVLILTHNRPELFQRCLKSVLNNLPKNVEILVNNDSNDITEIKHNQIKYFYKTSNNLSDIYKFLYDKSSKNYVYFLEDDDYVIPKFWKIINKLTHDLYYMNFFKVGNKDILSKNMLQFTQEKINNEFQLSQILFKKDKCTDFPNGNCLDNDWILYQNVLNNSDSVKLIKIPMFTQTTDGNDNISFKEYNSDKRFI